MKWKECETFLDIAYYGVMAKVKSKSIHQVVNLGQRRGAGELSSCFALPPHPLTSSAFHEERSLHSQVTRC